jgi:two-component system, NtrC family, response regulator AtoC
MPLLTDRIGQEVALRVLLVEDDADLREPLGEALREARHEVVLASDGEQGLALVTEQTFDVVVSDINLPKVDGHTLLRRVLAETPDTRVILMTAYGDIAHAVAALQQGAYDYLAKPLELGRLLALVRRIAEQRTLERELAHARITLARLAPQTLLIGDSPPMRRVLEKIDMVAASNATALIVGESGTGKEIVARLIHDRSPRRANPYLTVNCGALAESLMDAELFGHERGAFTGAERRREGRFKAADGGTIFLDEVAELSLTAQAKLLRVLQDGTFEPIGSNKAEKVDVRVISATHRNLQERVKQKAFREDLFYRINGIELPLPPLRARPGDLPFLVHHFLQKFTLQGPVPALSAAAWEALARHRYPGNVRELSHAVQHAVVLSGGAEIQVAHLPASLQTVAPDGGPIPRPRQIRPLFIALRECERQCLEVAMDEAGGDRALAAKQLGVTRQGLASKLRLHGLLDGASDEIDPPKAPVA